jgi:hypothetical protein
MGLPLLLLLIYNDDDEGQINLSIFFHFPSILLYTDRFFLSKWACLWE